MPLIVRIYSPEELERARKFSVHQNYITAVAQYLRSSNSASGEELIAAILTDVKGRPAYRRIRRRNSQNRERLAQFLTIAWASELQLRLAQLTEASLLQYSNAWAPIHAYYAAYMSAQAWFLAMGEVDLVDNHTGALNTLSNQVRDRGLFPLPWAVGCNGCPQLDECEFIGAPPEADLGAKCEVLSSPDLASFWPRYGTMLRTTRERRLDRSFQEWKRRKNRKAMRKDEKREVASRLPATTMFDFLWRLRVRSNYRDVSAFLMSGVSPVDHQSFLAELLCVTECTCSIMQQLVVAYVGPDVLSECLADFLRNQNEGLRDLWQPFAARADLLLP